jgi:drug/metabolite transporter (DMT)-like permease
LLHRSAYLVLFAALFLVSTSGPFLVMAHLDAYAAVFLRMALSAPLFLGWAAWQGKLQVPAAQRGPLVVGALLLTAHFCLWIRAFDLTDYASNLLLLVAQPMLAALLGRRLGQTTTRRTWISIALATVGLVVLAGADLSLGLRALLGDLLCILGGLAITLFYVVTREARARVPIVTFMGCTMAVGTVAMLPVLLLTDTRLAGYPAAAWGWLGALVLLTTVFGHGLMNVAARRVDLFTLNLVIVLEPAIGIAIGALLWGATITFWQLIGGIVLCASVIVGLQRPVLPSAESGRSEVRRAA